MNQDPFEKNGIRSVLNLGHTLGHVIESQNKIPHGEAVLMGTIFALRWSQHLGLLKSDFVSDQVNLRQSSRKLKLSLRKLKDPSAALKLDKKISASQEIKFIFLGAPGKPIPKQIKLKAIITEIQRQAYEV